MTTNEEVRSLLGLNEMKCVKINLTQSVAVRSTVILIIEERSKGSGGKNGAETGKLRTRTNPAPFP